jgi:hypothetical protein
MLWRVKQEVMLSVGAADKQQGILTRKDRKKIVIKGDGFLLDFIADLRSKLAIYLRVKRELEQFYRIIWYVEDKRIERSTQQARGSAFMWPAICSSHGRVCEKWNSFVRTLSSLIKSVSMREKYGFIYRKMIHSFFTSVSQQTDVAGSILLFFEKWSIHSFLTTVSQQADVAGNILLFFLFCFLFFL